MESCAYGWRIHYWSGTLINNRGLFFRLARSNRCAGQEKFCDKTDSRVHIFQKQHTKNPGIRQFWDLNLRLEKIGSKLYKTPPYHPQSNGLAERMMQTVKSGLKTCSQQKEKIEVFLPRLFLRYRTIPHTGRLESPSALMGRQIRALLTMTYSTNKKNVVQKEKRIKCWKGRIYHAKRPQYSYNK